MSRTLLFSCLIVLLMSPTGCMVLDEIDAANAKMKTVKKTEPAKDDSMSAASKAIQTKNELLKESKEWWNEATSLTPTEMNSGIVTCRTQSGTQFMSKSDCLTRGGVPQNVSG